MAVKRASELRTELNSEQADNTSGAIAPTNVREPSKNMVDSLLPTQTEFFNDTGVTITKGSFVNAAGFDATNDILKAVLADSSSAALSSSVIGMVVEDVLDQAVGIALDRIIIDNIDTSGLTAGGITYLSTVGTMTSVRPLHPNLIFICGTVTKVNASTGVMQVFTSRFERATASRSYSFTSQGIGSGQHNMAGFYDWPATDANLTQASLTQTHGTAGQSRGAHAGIVAAAAGTVDAGVVGLRVNGTTDDDEGTQTASQSETISTDITTLSTDDFLETITKFSGQVTFELFTVSGSPVNFSLDFNYGYSAYEDFGNRDVTISNFEATWLGGAADATGFDIELFHHTATGWTYSAAAFVAGNGNFAKRSDDQAIEQAVANGVNGKWRRINVNQSVLGSIGEGVLIEVSTGANNTVQILNVHLSAVSEELVN